MKNTDEKRNKRSLKRRILKMLSIINFNSLLIMLILVMLLFGAAVSFFGKMVSENISIQMKRNFIGIWDRAVYEGDINNNLDEITLEHKKIFRHLGENYRLINRDDKFFEDPEKLDIKMLLEEKNMDEGKNSIENILLVEYEVLKDNEIIFSTRADNTDGVEGIAEPRLEKIMGLMNLMSIEAERPVELKGVPDKVTLKVRLSPFLILIGYLSIVFVGIIIFFITHFIGQVLARTFSGLVIKPLNDLDHRLNQLAEGNIEAAMNSEIVLKKPIKEVESLANSTNKIISKMSEYVSLMESHKSELQAQNLALEENSATLTSMNTDIQSKHSKLRNILSYMEQGFLTFNKYLNIDDEYSLECERIFGEAIANNKLSNLLHPNDKGMQKFIDDLLIKIFDSNKSQKKLYLSLLPEEVLIKDKNISITYKLVTNESNEEILMIILNDITEKRKLEKRMDEERNILKMVVKAIINRNEFLQLVNEYKNFAEGSFIVVEEEELDGILRNVHNFKGNFSQFDMINIVKKLDELENRLYEGDSCFNPEILNGSEMLSWINEDIDIIEAYVGKDFLKEEEIFYIKKSKLLEIEEKLKLMLSSQECKVVLPIIKSIGYKSMKELLRTYPPYVQKLSERLSKPINLMEITGDDVFVDINHYRDLSRALVHIFRNCIDHGIENEDERLEKGKEQLGSLKCHIDEHDGEFSIIISDDGKGIEIEALEKKALELGFYTEEQLLNMSREQKLNLIFEQGISTKENATTISGRGVGMASVKNCVQEIGGDIKVESEKDVYTRFIITVPKIEEITEKLVTAAEFIESMTNVTRNIILKHTGLNMQQKEMEEKNIIELNKVTSLINLNGSINCIIMISANEEMAIKLVEGFIFEPLNAEEKNEYVEDVIGEVCNNILGNTFGVFDDGSNIFHMGIPAMISNNGAYVKYTDLKILTTSLQYEKYIISISMLMLQNEDLGTVKEDLIWQEY